MSTAGKWYPGAKFGVMKRRFPMRAIALVLLASLSSFAAPLPAIGQSSLAELTFALVAPGTAGWPLILAQSQGFYKDEGIAVTMVVGGTPPNVVNQVATG